MCTATQDSFSLTIVLLLGLSLTANAQSSRGSDNGSPLPFPRAASGIPSETTDGDDDARLAKTLIPHPYLLVGPWLIGAGYARLAWRLEAGLDVESDYVVITAAAAYDNGPPGE
jgi:hypothetical protein